MFLGCEVGLKANLYYALNDGGSGASGQAWSSLQDMLIVGCKFSSYYVPNMCKMCIGRILEDVCTVFTAIFGQSKLIITGRGMS